MTAATAVTEAATAWPDGNDPPLVWTSEPGGLGLLYTFFNGAINASEVTMAATNAAKCHHRRRNARNPATANRIGSVTYASPRRFRPFATAVSGADRMDTIWRRKASSIRWIRARVDGMATRTNSSAVAPARAPTTAASRRGIASRACSLGRPPDAAGASRAVSIRGRGALLSRTGSGLRFDR